MLRKMFFSLAVMGLAATSQAAIIISEESSPTVDKPGFTTYVLTATETSGDKIIGFDFVGNGLPLDQGGLGFFGPMNQVVGGPITSAVFADSNGFFGFIGANVSQDSQFSVVTTNGLAVNPSESQNHLRAAFNFNAANVGTATNVLQFAQLAIPDSVLGSVQYSGSFTVRSATAGDRLERVQGVVPGTPEIPEPSTIALAGFAILGLVGFRLRK